MGYRVVKISCGIDDTQRHPCAFVDGLCTSAFNDQWLQLAAWVGLSATILPCQFLVDACFGVLPSRGRQPASHFFTFRLYGRNSHILGFVNAGNWAGAMDEDLRDGHSEH